MELYALAFATAVTFQCMPVYAAWDLGVRGKCIDSILLIVAAACSICEDLA
jgi:hypothetical protein